MMTVWKLGDAARRMHEETDRELTEYALRRQIDFLKDEVARLEAEVAWLHDCLRRRPDPNKIRRKAR